METQTHFSRLLLGAAIGAGFAYLFLTKDGQRLLTSAEPWLDDVIRDMQRLRGAAAKARDAVSEGKRSFAAVSELSRFGKADRMDEPHH